jgi:hypothetical protein
MEPTTQPQPEQPPTEVTGKQPWYRKRWVIPAAALLVGMVLGFAMAGGDPTTSPEYGALEQELAEARNGIATAREKSSAAADRARTAENELAEREAELETTEAPAPTPTATRTPTAAPAPKPAPAPPPATPELSVAQANALEKAREYLSFTAFSHSGLIEQLKFEGFATADATWAVDNLTVDWNAQAAKKAEEYMSFSSFSRSSLIDQLMFEGFSREQAEHGASAVGL